MRSISFISANYVGRASNYPGGSVSDWGKFDAVTLAQDPARHFPSIVADVVKEGFKNIDLWTAHCHWQRHGHAAADAVKRLCNDVGLTITSYIGGFAAERREEAQVVFAQMNRLGAKLFSGMIWGQSDERLLPMIDETAQQYGLRWAHENHPEKSPDQMLARIARGKYQKIGICLDTGWCGTQGLDALEAVKAVRPHLFIVHLKDVEAAGGHETCALGDGVVPVEKVVRYLVETNWDGVIGIEHEPFDRDPMPEVRASLTRLREWLS